MQKMTLQLLLSPKIVATAATERTLYMCRAHAVNTNNFVPGTNYVFCVDVVPPMCSMGFNVDPRNKEKAKGLDQK